MAGLTSCGPDPAGTGKASIVNVGSTAAWLAADAGSMPTPTPTTTVSTTPVRTAPSSRVQAPDEPPATADLLLPR